MVADAVCCVECVHEAFPEAEARQPFKAGRDALQPEFKFLEMTRVVIDAVQHPLLADFGVITSSSL